MLQTALANQHARHRGIHQARKSIRRLRAMLSLTHAAHLGVVRSIDAQLKNMATSLSALRDAQVAVETASRMIGNTQNAERRMRWMVLRRQLMVQRKALLDEAMRTDPEFAQRSLNVASVRNFLEAVRWSDVGPGAVKEALSKNLRRCKKAEKAAERDDAGHEERHRWRRRLRRLRMQWSALKVIEKDMAKTAAADQARRLVGWLRREGVRASALSRAVDTFGADQDLQLLARAIGTLAPTVATAFALSDLERLDQHPGGRAQKVGRT